MLSAFRFDHPLHHSWAGCRLLARSAARAVAQSRLSASFLACISELDLGGVIWWMLPMAGVLPAENVYNIPGVSLKC